MKELILFSASVLTLLIASICYSYKFQKSFTNLTKPVKILVGLLALMVILISSLYFLMILDIFTYSEHMFNFKFINDFQKNNIKNIAPLTIISVVNIFNFLVSIIFNCKSFESCLQPVINFINSSFEFSFKVNFKVFNVCSDS